jgi:uracil-DNA glycosylase
VIRYRYLLDENVTPILRDALNRIEPEITVWRVGDPGVPENGTPDPVILEWCANQGFSLVTNNRKSMPGHLREFIALGRTAPAIFVLNANMPVGQTVSELRHIWGASEPHEYENTIRFLPIFR